MLQAVCDAARELSRGVSVSGLAWLEEALAERFRVPAFGALGLGGSLLAAMSQHEALVRAINHSMPEAAGALQPISLPPPFPYHRV